MTNSAIPVVYIVDDDESVRDSLRFMLDIFGFKAQCFVDGEDFIEHADLNAMGCVILDSRMPNMRGQQVQQQLVAKHSPLSIIFLTGHGDVPMAVDALKLGAIDFFQKPVDGEKLADAITRAHQFSIKAVQRIQIQEIIDTLTVREHEILRLITQGHKNQYIADTLCIAVRTVEVHRSSVMRKFNTKSVADLAMQYALGGE